MCGLVSLQVGLLTEGLLADGAGEGADVLVHPHVRRQIVSLCKDLATDLAVLEHPLAGLIVAGFEWAGGGHSAFGLLRPRSSKYHNRTTSGCRQQDQEADLADNFSG